MSGPVLAAVRIAGDPAPWAELGFAAGGGRIELPGVSLELGAPGHGIVGWSLWRADALPADVDGLATTLAVEAPPPGVPQPNGIIGIDHLVVVSPAFERTAGALERAGLPLRRVREVPARGERAGFRQGFRRLGPVILELVEAGEGSGRAAFWGLTFAAADLDALADRLGERLGSIRPAVQPGRRIATLRAAAGVDTAVAFMDAEPA